MIIFILCDVELQDTICNRLIVGSITLFDIIIIILLLLRILLLRLFFEV